MRGSDRVDIKLLHKLKVSYIVLLAHSPTLIRVCIVVVYALKLYRRAVYKQLVIRGYLDRAEPDFSCYNFARGIKLYRIKLRRLGCP